MMLNLIYGLLALAVVISLIGIANTLALSVHERTRELGLLRAVGMHGQQLRRAVRWEALLISALGALLGAGLAVGGAWGIVTALSLGGRDRDGGARRTHGDHRGAGQPGRRPGRHRARPASLQAAGAGRPLPGLNQPAWRPGWCGPNGPAAPASGAHGVGCSAGVERPGGARRVSAVPRCPRRLREATMLVAVITGTTREGRFSERVAAWVTERLAAVPHFDVELVDLRDHPLPFLDGAAPARTGRGTPARTSPGWDGPSTGPTASSS